VWDVVCEWLVDGGVFVDGMCDEVGCWLVWVVVMCEDGLVLLMLLLWLRVLDVLL